MGELIKRFGRPWRARAAAGVAAKVVEVVFDLMTPLVVARMIDVGVANRDTSVVLALGALLVALAFVGYGFTLVCQRMAAAVSQGMGTDIRNALYEKVNALSAAELDRIGTASLVTRVTSDVNQVQVAIALGVRQLVRWPFLALGSMVAALAIDVRLGLVFLVCTPLIAGVFWLVMSRSVPLFRIIQGRLDTLARIAREGLVGARVIRAFGRESGEESRFHTAAASHASAAIEVGRLSAVLNPATLLVMDLGVVAILWAGGGQVNVGRLGTGDVVAFVNYMTQTLLAIVYVANLVIVFTRGTASAGRVMEVLGMPVAVDDRATARLDVVADAAGIAFDDVSFTYAGGAEPALSHVSARVKAGGTLGVIGGTGSGKSTFAALFARLYDPSCGSVAILGNDARSYPLAQLRELVSVVPQEAVLVSGTIRSNLSWRDEAATDEELWAALETAQAADFVRAKPLGLDEPVEAGGKNFSGGQRQRLTIARGLVGAPRVIVLDDSASALDFATDARLRTSLARLGNMTKVIISQRVSAIADADLILVLNHGRVAGLGTADELLATCDLYCEIVESQLGFAGNGAGSERLDVSVGSRATAGDASSTREVG